MDMKEQVLEALAKGCFNCNSTKIKPELMLALADAVVESFSPAQTVEKDEKDREAYISQFKNALYDMGEERDSAIEEAMAQREIANDLCCCGNCDHYEGESCLYGDANSGCAYCPAWMNDDLGKIDRKDFIISN